MNPFFQQIIIKTINVLNKNKKEVLNPNNFHNEKNKLRTEAFYILKNFTLISFGVLSAGFGLKSFLLPSSFIDGGVTGISLLLSELTGVPLSILIILINIPFLVLGFSQIGRSFGIKSIIAILALALVIAFFKYPIITTDKLLVAAFGGFFLGLGVGLCVRGGAVLDGTEVLAIYLSKKTKLTIGDIIMVFNVVIFMAAAYLLTAETALYAILTYLSAAKTVDFVIEGVEEYTGVTIVSNHSEEIRVMITEQLGRGVTIYNGKRGFGKRGETLGQIEIIYTVITRLEIAKLQAETEKIDPEVFIVMNSLKDTKGGMIKKRPLH